MIRNAREVQSSPFDVVERLRSGHEPILSKMEELVGVARLLRKGASKLF